MTSKIIRPDGGRYQKRTPMVKIAIPFYTGLPASGVLMNDLVGKDGIPGYNTALAKQEGTIITLARNDLAYDPPELEWDFLFFLDDDMGFSREQMVKPTEVFVGGKMVTTNYFSAMMKQILDHDLDICGGVYCMRGAPHRPLVFKSIPDTQSYLHIVDLPEKGVQEVDGIATGFLCIKKRVIDAFDQDFAKRWDEHKKYMAWKEENAEYLDGLPTELKAYLAMSKPALYPPFWTDWIYSVHDEKWKPVGEDIYFCREAQRLGFKIHADYDAQIGHSREQFITPEHYRHAYMEEQVKTQKKWTIDHKLLPEENVTIRDMVMAAEEVGGEESKDVG